MNKKFYEAPNMEEVVLNLSNSLLAGSTEVEDGDMPGTVPGAGSTEDLG